MKKILLIANTSSMIELFNLENIRILIDKGIQVYVGCNFDRGNITSLERIRAFKEYLKNLNISYFNIPFPRNILNIVAILNSFIKLIKIREQYKFDIIHTHSPISSLITRLIFSKSRSKGLKIIYTAHGFHFFKGSSLISKIIYRPLEYFLSYKTDCLITINDEDYKYALKNFKTKVYYLPGIGINLDSFNSYKYISKVNFKNSDKMVLCSVGQLSKRKNHKVVLKALSILKDIRIDYFIVGLGENFKFLKKLISKYNLSDHVKLLGFRSDIKEILLSCDLFVFPSFQEGLPVALMEAMAIGLPIIASQIRGNTDLIESEVNGFLFNPRNYKQLSKIIRYSYDNKYILEKFSVNNLIKIQNFSNHIVNKLMNEIYSNYSN
jgi:glycosyltransferase involved in cell wall biosynthesis